MNLLSKKRRIDKPRLVSNADYRIATPARMPRPALLPRLPPSMQLIPFPPMAKLHERALLSLVLMALAVNPFF